MLNLLFYVRGAGLMYNPHMQVTTIIMAPGNRMVRLGLGQNDGRWFARLDLWWVGFRLTAS